MPRCAAYRQHVAGAQRAPVTAAHARSAGASSGCRAPAARRAAGDGEVRARSRAGARRTSTAAAGRRLEHERSIATMRAVHVRSERRPGNRDAACRASNAQRGPVDVTSSVAASGALPTRRLASRCDHGVHRARHGHTRRLKAPAPEILHRRQQPGRCTTGSRAAPVLRAASNSDGVIGRTAHAVPARAAPAARVGIEQPERRPADELPAARRVDGIDAGLRARQCRPTRPARAGAARRGAASRCARRRVPGRRKPGRNPSMNTR